MPRLELRIVRGELVLRGSAVLSQSLSRNIKAACLPGQDLNTGLSEVKTQIDPRNVRNSEYQGKQSLSPPLSLPRYTDGEAEVQKGEPLPKNAQGTGHSEFHTSLGWATVLCRSGLGDGGKRVRRGPQEGCINDDRTPDESSPLLGCVCDPRWVGCEWAGTVIIPGFPSSRKEKKAT